MSTVRTATLDAAPTADPAAVAGLRLAAANVTAAGLGAVYTILSARLLGPRQYSDLAVCLSLSYVGLLFLGPLNLTLIRFSGVYRSAASEANIRPLLRKAFRMYVPYVAVAIGAAVVFAGPIAHLLKIAAPVLVPWTGMFVAIGLALGAGRATALGMHEDRLYGGSLIADATIRVAVGLAVVFAFRTAGAALAGFIAGGLGALGIIGARTRHLLPRQTGEWTDSADVSRFMTWALAFSTVVAGLQNLDMVMAKVRLDAVSAGHYAVVLALARCLLLLAAPFSAVALAREPASTDQDVSAASSWRTRLAHSPIAAYLALSVPTVGVLALAPDLTLRVLLGRPVPEQAALLPVVGMAFLLAGAFLIAAHGEIRAGRFSFLVPVAVALAAEQLLLLVIPPTPGAIAWTVLLTQAAAVGSVVFGSAFVTRLRRFEGSAQYWESRYARGGASGDGSRGKFAQFKAEVLNDFVARHQIQSVIEFGCGDGGQLALAAYPPYLGFDVSAEAVRRCRERFKDDRTKAFRLVGEYAGERADLTLSLDVIFHLVEDEVFDQYMGRLFDASMRWVIVYSSDHEGRDGAEAAHVRHRHFTAWVTTHRPEWALRTRIPNRYPFAGDFRLGSFSDFFIFERA